ncbi:hypothetical protein ABT224_33590 [Streptomyces sp. NPDC001584]|uniref:hypothetical protein n=1 Tax=Streptomyces sp. NPDC001584 TaxID=3154521 RepID=UPI003317E715
MSELPDIYETRQARAILEALQAGDVERARKLEDHLLAEAADGPEERETLRDQLRASMLFRAQIDASSSGDEATAAMFQEILTQTCSEKVIRTTIASALLHTGLAGGELPAENHDFLTRHLDENGVSAELKELAAGIRRVP